MRKASRVVGATQRMDRWRKKNTENMSKGRQADTMKGREMGMNR